MAPSAQAGGGGGQAPGPGVRQGIRAVLLGPPGAGKGTQVRGYRGATWVSSHEGARAFRVVSRLSGRWDRAVRLSSPRPGPGV